MVLAEDGSKMSVETELPSAQSNFDEYGADALRVLDQFARRSS